METYFVGNNLNSYVKIGRSKNTKVRIENIRGSIAFIELHILHIVSGDYEALFHLIFKEKRKSGEWFELSSKDIDYVRSLEAETLLKMRFDHFEARGPQYKHSELTKKKISESRKDKKLSEEHKKKTSDTMKSKGIRPTDEAVAASNAVRRRRILEYDLDGNFVREWGSVSEIVKSVGRGDTTTVSACCSQKVKTCMGKIFRYWQIDYPLKVEPPLRKKRIFGPRKPRNNKSTGLC